MPSLRIQRMQKTDDAALLAFSEPMVIAKAGTTASRPISPLIEQAQRRRALVALRPAARADSGATHIRVTYSARNMPATITIVAVNASSRAAGSLSTDDRATASSPAPNANRWKARQRRPLGLKLVWRRIA